MDSQSWQVSSPNSKLSIRVCLTAGKLTYDVRYRLDGRRNSIISPSALGMLRADEAFDAQLSFVSAEEIMAIEEAYQMLTGKQRSLRSQANEQVLNFANPNGAPLQISC